MSGQSITNPSWNPSTFNHDIALLRLPAPAQLGPRVAPVCLVPANLNLPSSLQGVTTGWGRVNPNSTRAAAWGGGVCAACSHCPSRGFCGARLCLGAPWRPADTGAEETAPLPCSPSLGAAPAAGDPAPHPPEPVQAARGSCIPSAMLGAGGAEASSCQERSRAAPQGGRRRRARGVFHLRRWRLKL